MKQFPDKKFFWGICFTILPLWANQYFDKVMAERNRKPAPIEKKTLVVSARWIARLEEHDFTSKGKDRYQEYIILYIII